MLVTPGAWHFTETVDVRLGDGDENDHVFAVDVRKGLIRDLTPFVGVRAENILLDRRVPNAMLVGLNVRSPHVFDLYRVDLETGALALEAENPGDVIEWTAGPGLRGRACTALRRGDVASVLRALYALARRGLVVNDLHRARVPYLFGRAVFGRVFASRVSVHDGLLSIRRAFTPRELRDAFRAAGISQVRVRRSFPYRLVAVAVKG